MSKLIKLEDDELETITEMLREYKASIQRGYVGTFPDGDDAEIAAATQHIVKLERIGRAL